MNAVDPSGKVIGLDDIIYTVGETAFVAGISSEVTTYLTTHSPAFQAFVTGAIGGALAGTAALWGNFTYISGVVGMGLAPNIRSLQPHKSRQK